MGKHFNLYEHDHGSSTHLSGLLLRQSKNQLRRVWVKRPSGTPTTIMIGCDQIVDDLKQAVVNKFPNSLARNFDPAEIQILVRGGHDKTHHSIRRPKRKAQSKNVTHSAEDLSTKSSISAGLAQNLGPGLGQAGGASPNLQSGSGVSGDSELWQDLESYTILAPDQNVWDIMNEYYGGSMLIEDAFLVDVEANEPVLPKGPVRVGDDEDFLYDRDVSMSQKLIDKFPLLQLRLTDTRSPSSIPDQIYHHPRPQYPHYSNHVYTGAGGSGHLMKPSHNKNLSVSPNFGPRATLMHSSSTLPPTKLTRIMLPSSPGPFNASSAKNANSQPVLLLPKNFSLGEQHGNKPAGHLDDSSSKSATGKSKPQSDVSNHERDDGDDDGRSDTRNGSAPASLEKVMSSGSGHSRHNSEAAATNGQNASHNIGQNGGQSGGHSDLKSLPLTKTTSSKSHITGTVQRPHDVKSGASSGSSKSKDKNTLSTFEKVLPLISVLVVEDNSINQAILGAFLRKHKIHYQIAKNGQEAVDKWRKGGFHLVLMDIQLPVKSGIEATKEIRNLEKINRIGVFAQHELIGTTLVQGQEEITDDLTLDLDLFRSPVIIVALTASSNSSVDKKNALTAGCNDFLTKPVNLVWLQNKITEWGCMQALIDFDGWKDKRTKAFSSTGKDVKA